MKLRYDKIRKISDKSFRYVFLGLAIAYFVGGFFNWGLFILAPISFLLSQSFE